MFVGEFQCAAFGYIFHDLPGRTDATQNQQVSKERCVVTCTEWYVVTRVSRVTRVTSGIRRLSSFVGWKVVTPFCQG